MSFTSLRFFVLIAALLPLLALPLARRTKTILICAASILFYAAADPRYVVLLLLIAGIDYLCAARIDASDATSTRNAWLAVSVVTNLAILGWFKYAGLFGAHVFLPAGISFYTLKSMSYTIDVHRRTLRPVRSLLDYAMFVTFFPDLIAGPIVRASVFLPQLDRDPGPTRERLASGASLFLVGLGKKLLIADHCAVIANDVFVAPQTWSCFDAWCGLIAYALQIYGDFSGYSDMAIGTAKMLGYDLPENFRMPYLAANIAEFWRRWHITLSAWLRDYVYIPLGGNRRGRARTYLNVLLTMTIGGLWHGASWNFALWGLLHGLALAAHRACRSLWPDFRMSRVLSTPLTTMFVVLLWVPFRATTSQATTAMYRALFGLGAGRNHWLPVTLAASLLLVILGHVVRLPKQVADRVHDPISGPFFIFRMSTITGAAAVTLAAATIYYLGAVESSPFIYFRF